MLDENTILNIALFIVFQLLNIISSTVKNVIVIKCKNEFIAGLANAINYVINFIVIKYTSFLDIYIIITVTFFSNLVGVPLGRMLINKFTKSKLWIYNGTVKATRDVVERFHKELKLKDIHSVYYEIEPEQLYNIKIFAYSREDSSFIKSYLQNHDCKYHIMESV